MGFITETRMGAPISAGHLTIFPISRMTALLPASDAGGVIWNTPHSILVRGADGGETVLRIRDVTRERQILLLGLGLLGALLLRLARRNRK
jgi:hypothetical protein